jgi:hypothetical protein
LAKVTRGDAFPASNKPAPPSDTPAPTGFRRAGYEDEFTSFGEFERRNVSEAEWQDLQASATSALDDHQLLIKATYGDKQGTHPVKAAKTVALTV